MDKCTLERPKLRSSAVIRLSSDHAVAEGPAGTHLLRYAPEARAAMEELIGSLALGGLETSELCLRHPQIEGLPDLIEQLDGLHLLTETDFQLPAGLMSGAQLDRVVWRMVRRLQGRIAQSRFHTALCDRTATRRQLIGYALEYFWLVRAAPALVAPSLATAPDLEVRIILQDFLASELNHDRYLLKALHAAGIDHDLTYLQPLPTTFQICASLGAYAQQHPLSFRAALFLFEEPRPDFIQAFEQRCKELGLSEEFYRPLSEHSGINEDAGHGAISTRLLNLTEVVDREEQVVVLRNMAVLVETMVQQEDQILDYYGDKSRPFPRLFD